MRLDVFNEIMVQVAYYHLFEFTYFTSYANQQGSGMSFVVIMIAITGVNLGLMIRKNFLKYRNNKRLLKIQKKYQQKAKAAAQKEENDERLRIARENVKKKRAEKLKRVEEFERRMQEQASSSSETSEEETPQTQNMVPVKVASRPRPTNSR